MERYKNLSGISGVLAYEAGEESIQVQFQDGSVYLYTYESAGRENVEEMKALANEGRGLSTFISQVVKDRYASQQE